MFSTSLENIIYYDKAMSCSGSEKVQSFFLKHSALQMGLKEFLGCREGLCN